MRHQIRQVLNNKNWLLNKALRHPAQQKPEKNLKHDIEQRIFSSRYGISPNFLMFYHYEKNIKKVLFLWSIRRHIYN